MMGTVDRDNRQWLDELTLPTPMCNSSIEDLRSFLLKGLTAAFSSSQSVDIDTLEDITQIALVRILEKLDTFHGNSRFTTWCMKIAVNLTYSELRKKQWEHVSLDSITVPENFINPLPSVRKPDSPENQSLKQSVLTMVNTMIARELTEKQRKVFTAVMKRGMPMQEIARHMGTSRGAVYKMIHDARKKMKQSIEEKGFNIEELMELFN